MQIDVGFLGFGCEHVSMYDARSVGCTVFYVTSAPPGVLRLIDLGAHPMFLVARQHEGPPTTIVWLRVGTGRFQSGVLMSGIEAAVLAATLIGIAIAAIVTVRRRRRRTSTRAAG